MELLIGIGFGTAIGGAISYWGSIFREIKDDSRNNKSRSDDNDNSFAGIKSGKPMMEIGNFEFFEKTLDEDPPLLHEIFSEILYWQMGDKIDIRENSSLHSKPIGLIFNGVNDDQNMVFTDHNGHIKLYR